MFLKNHAGNRPLIEKWAGVRWLFLIFAFSKSFDLTGLVILHSQLSRERSSIEDVVPKKTGQKQRGKPSLSQQHGQVPHCGARWPLKAKYRNSISLINI